METPPSSVRQVKTGAYKVMCVTLDEESEFKGESNSSDFLDANQLLCIVSGRIRLSINELNTRRAFIMGVGACIDIGPNTFYKITPLPPANHQSATVYGTKFWLCSLDETHTPTMTE